MRVRAMRARASGGDGRARPRDRVGAGARRPMVGVARRRVARYLPPEEAKLRASRRLSGWTVRTRARALIANMAVSRERRIRIACRADTAVVLKYEDGEAQVVDEAILPCVDVTRTPRDGVHTRTEPSG